MPSGGGPSALWAAESTKLGQTWVLTWGRWLWGASIDKAVPLERWLSAWKLTEDFTRKTLIYLKLEGGVGCCVWINVERHFTQQEWYLERKEARNNDFFFLIQVIYLFIFTQGGNRLVFAGLKLTWFKTHQLFILHNRPFSESFYQSPKSLKISYTEWFYAPSALPFPS